MNTKVDESGTPVKTTWNTVEFDNCESAEKYCDSKEGRGVKNAYTYKGNIFRCYNHQSFLPLHLIGKDKADFDCERFKEIGCSPQEVYEYSLEHNFIAPPGFF
ncbi:MAG: hypothetical protein LBU60_06170 [Clostridiales bacterium]|nr:hypothetical protein [Clostridiales bacterium]